MAKKITTDEVVVEKPKKKAASFQIGYIGQEVKALQRKLGLPETGIYDMATAKAETK